jgi:penicillin-binding protein 1C
MRGWRGGLVAAAALALLLLLALRLVPHPSLRSRIASSTAVFDDRGHLLRLTLAADQQYRLWTPLERISPDFVAALLLHEDRYFYRHPGVNPPALLRAAFVTYSGGMRQGASTITMQLARLLYGLDTRHPAGKLRQIACALWLELRYSKHDILEAEINLLPYGQNVQGIGAASLIYFGKTPDRLTLAEALDLVLIPQAPAARTPEGREPEPLRAARQRLFASWAQEHPQARRIAALMPAPLNFRGLRRLPFAAPHLVDALLAQPHGEVIRATLDPGLQQLLENRVAARVAGMSRYGVNNAAAMLVDTRDMAVEALVGSADFFSDAIHGQVNGAFAKRSPGSALKPFLYALAMDQGLIHPQSMLKDAPTAFGAYAPENFDGGFAGPITAHDALIRSRNIPAVALAAQLGQPDFYDFLRLAGIADMASREHYGLALVLGGGEVTMAEMARLYAMLADRGVLRPLRYRVDDPVATDGTVLLSPEASFMVLDILKDNPRPDAVLAQPATRIPVAWKTGTSWAFRDAWTAGVFGPYVLVVWMGNFDGSGNPALVGVQAAAPLFFSIVDAVLAQHPGLQAPLRNAPAHLARVAVCATSGDLPNADCPRTVTTWFIPGKSPIRVSTVDRRVYIDRRTGRQACPPYDPRYVTSEVYEFWPSDLQHLFAEAGMPRRRPPPPGDCSQVDAPGMAPAITSPLNGVTYTLRLAHGDPRHDGSDAVPLSANADADVRTLYWFVDDSFVESVAPGANLQWQPPHSGRFDLRVVDDHGRADARTLRVAIAP